MLVETTVQRLRLSAVWFYEDRLIMPAGTGWTLGCALIARLAELKVPVLVVIQYGRDEWKPHPHGNRERAWTAHVTACAEKAGMAVLDTAPLLEARQRDGGLDATYREGHHSPEGNRLVAEAVAARLRQMGF